MELPTGVNQEKLDALGAHFKFKEIHEKLQNGDKLQQQRSFNLLAYQEFYSSNEPVIKMPISTKPSIPNGKDQ